MNKNILLGSGLFILGVIVCVALAYKWYKQASKNDDAYFESEILAFEESDKQAFPKTNGIVFVGSSSIRFWNSLSEDMSPLPVIRRGFGGAHMSHVLHNFDRIITPYQPKAVVVFVGENDLHSGKDIERVITDYEEFIDKVENRLPDAELWILSMKPSKSRWKLWGDMQKVDDAFKGFSTTSRKIYYVATGGVLLNADGMPDDVYIFDGLHLNDEGYRRWARLLKPILLDKYHSGE